MKIVKFKEVNVVYGANQPEYHPLPMHRYPGDRSGRCVCCWRLSWRERLRVFFTGKLWHEVLTFGAPLQPQLMAVKKPKGMAPASKDPEAN